MTRPEREDSRSLLELLRLSYKTDEAGACFQTEQTAPGVKLPDGYVRLSPEQPYREGPGWRRKRILRIVLLCAVAAAIVAVVILIRKYGIRLSMFKF